MRKTAKKLAASISALVFALCLAATGIFAWFGAGDSVSQTNGSFANVCAVTYLTEKDYDRTVASKPVRSETDRASETFTFEGGITYTLTVVNFSLGTVKISFTADVPVYFDGVIELTPSDQFTLSETGEQYPFELSVGAAKGEHCTVTLTVVAV